MRYLVLYRSSTPAREMMVSVSPEQAKAGMEAWMAWAQQAGDTLVDMGSPVGSGMRLSADSTGAGETTVTGYSILEADSESQVLDLLRGHPHLHTPGDSA